MLELKVFLVTIDLESLFGHQVRILTMYLLVEGPIYQPIKPDSFCIDTFNAVV